ncbi:uncharacterized protein LOC143602975 [Bidens hawaiensis]|uniref:uncharacterized protein LOC143602975 n=1 Tax=Bidens hawaiensis TaxID=980011 RepID=UPI00404A201B
MSNKKPKDHNDASTSHASMSAEKRRAYNTRYYASRKENGQPKDHLGPLDNYRVTMNASVNLTKGCTTDQRHPRLLVFGLKIVDVYIKLETSHLQFCEENQNKIRADLYKVIVDCVNAGEVLPSRGGKRIVLPATFIGGPRNMRRRFLDAITLVQDDGKPDLFLTMTCNPGWPEIRDNLKVGQTAQDRPDHVSRVFCAKLEDLKEQLFKKHLLGEVKAYIYVIEFQKHGLPHAQFLLIMYSQHNISIPDHYDKVVCAEIPDILRHPKLHKLVVNHMMHGPCGHLRISIPCSRRWNRLLRKAQKGRIVSANPAEGERYYLRLLLSNVKGPTSIQDLCKVNGVQYTTFRKAALEIGLIENDERLSQCHAKDSVFQFPSALRILFATIIIFCKRGDVRKLWNDHFESLSEDHQLNCQNVERVQNLVLTEIRDLLQSMVKDINLLDPPSITEDVNLQHVGYREVQEEYGLVVEAEHLRAKDSLNSDQNIVCVLYRRSRWNWKTFVYKALLAEVRSRGLIALATASSCAAANNMPGGRTAHSRFKIPLNVDNNSMCGLTTQSGAAELIRLSKIIIWDEASMAKRHAIEEVDRTFQDIIGVSLPFGGKIMVMGGDFRQVLPVIKRGTRAQVVDSSLRMSPLWSLTIKM